MSVSFNLPGLAGSAALAADPAQAGARAQFAFTYKAPAGGLPAGATVALRLPVSVHVGLSEIGDLALIAPVAADLTVEPVAGPRWMTRPLSSRYVIRCSEGLPGGVTVRLTFRARLPAFAAPDAAAAFMAPRATGVFDAMYRCQVAWSGHQVEAGTHLPIRAGSPIRLVALAPSTAQSGAPLWIRVHWEDAAGNSPTAAPLDGVPVVAGSSAALVDAAVPGDVPGIWNLQVHGLPQGIHRLRVVWGSWETTTNPIAVDVLPSPLYFGDLHCHTGYSGDGIGHPDYALREARERWGWDFVAITDHDPGPEAWAALGQATDAAHVPGRFVALHGYEHSCHGGEAGHRNVIFRGRALGPRSDRSPPEALGRDYPSEAFLAIPHHPNTTNRTDPIDGRGGVENTAAPIVWREVDWQREPRDRVPVVEIVQTRGSFEADELDPAWGIVRGGRGASARDALAQGWRLGFVGGSDNHASRAGQPAIRYRYPVRAGVTGVFAPALERGAIFDAIRTRRCYATSGARIVLWVTVNDAPMGSELSCTSERSAGGGRVLAAGTAPITDLQVVRDGEVVATWQGNQEDVTWQWRDPPEADARAMYYYVRLRQADGQVAFSSPIFVAGDRSG